MNVGQSVYTDTCSWFQICHIQMFFVVNFASSSWRSITCCGVKRLRLASVLSWEKWKVVYVRDNDLSRSGLDHCEPVCMGLVAAGVTRSVTMPHSSFQIYQNNNVVHKNFNIFSMRLELWGSWGQCLKSKESKSQLQRTPGASRYM